MNVIPRSVSANLICRYLPAALRLLGCLIATPTQLARAVETERFVLDSEKELAEGTLDGSAVDSRGQVIVGMSTQRFPVEDAATGRALLTTSNNDTFVGAGTKGFIYRLRGGKLSRFAETGTLMVTCLAEGPRGSLFAGTTSGGKVFQIARNGHVQMTIALPDTDHVWALAYDHKRDQLFAATGPEGKIFIIAPDGTAEVYLDTQAEHVMTLALSADGRLFAGTTDEALVLEVTGKEHARVVYDFEGNEITTIAVHGNDIAVGENFFPKPGSKKPGAAKAADKAPGKPKGNSSGNGQQKGKPGKGRLWLIRTDGNARNLFEIPSGHVTAVAFDGDAILAASGAEGQVYRVARDGTHALWADVDERQVLALEVHNGTTRFVTGDGAALYQTLPGTARSALWTSKALDAAFPARFGQLDFRGSGRFKLQTRSGNSQKPDGTWSGWSSPLTRPGPIRSPAARFLQIRATLKADAVLYAMTAYYLPQNQPPVIGAIHAAPAQAKDKSQSGKATSLYELRWEADSVDKDTLRYRLFYRPESAERLRPILSERVRWTKDNYRWNTDSIPDGYYVVRVVASDEMSNSDGQAQQHASLSEPFLIDNHPPHIEQLRLAQGRLVGRAVDDMGPISSLEYKVDNKPWKPLAPLDDLLDTARERFALPLPEHLAPGVHVVAVRARDARNNLGSAELEVTIRR